MIKLVVVEVGCLYYNISSNHFWVLNWDSGFSNCNCNFLSFHADFDDMTFGKFEDKTGLELILTICNTHYQNENKLCRKHKRYLTTSFYLSNLNRHFTTCNSIINSLYCSLMSIYVSVRGSYSIIAVCKLSSQSLNPKYQVFSLKGLDLSWQWNPTTHPSPKL